MKKTLALLALASAAVSLCATAKAAVSPFARAGLDYSLFKETKWGSVSDGQDGWDIGCFAEVGVAVGRHSIGVEVGFAKTDGHMREPFELFAIEKTQTPVLANYRYAIPLGTERVSLWVGATAGLFRDKYELTTESADSTGSDTNTLFVYGATAGAGVKLGRGFTLDAGVRVLAVRQDAYEGIGATNITIGRSTTCARPSVSLALGYTW